MTTTSINSEKKINFFRLRESQNMKIKNNGKVYPTPSSSSSSSSSSTSFSFCPNDGDVIFSVLKLLPAAILALASVLSLEDREVLAYMITRSLKTSSATSSLVQESKKKSSKKPSSNNTHKPPLFDCDCFDCYTSYWFRWDSSPNRELIHQVIEAFEDHLTNGEKSKKNGGRGKKREKMGRCETLKPINDYQAQSDVSLPDNVDASLEKDIVPMALPERNDEFERNEEKVENEAEAVEKKSEEDMAEVVRTAGVSNHRGLARKVLPDVLGLLNSRLWSLWNPNV